MELSYSEKTKCMRSSFSTLPKETQKMYINHFGSKATAIKALIFANDAVLSAIETIFPDESERMKALEKLELVQKEDRC